jgi:hypothetical protein
MITAKQFKQLLKWQDEGERKVELNLMSKTIWFYDYKVFEGCYIFLKDEDFYIPDLEKSQKEKDLRQLEILKQKYEVA